MTDELIGELETLLIVEISSKDFQFKFFGSAYFHQREVLRTFRLSDFVIKTKSEDSLYRSFFWKIFGISQSRKFISKR